MSEELTPKQKVLVDLLQAALAKRKVKVIKNIFLEDGEIVVALNKKDHEQLKFLLEGGE